MVTKVSQDYNICPSIHPHQTYRWLQIKFHNHDIREFSMNYKNGGLSILKYYYINNFYAFAKKFGVPWHHQNIISNNCNHQVRSYCSMKHIPLHILHIGTYLHGYQKHILPDISKRSINIKDNPKH